VGGKWRRPKRRGADQGRRLGFKVAVARARSAHPDRGRRGRAAAHRDHDARRPPRVRRAGDRPTGVRLRRRREGARGGRAAVMIGSLFAGTTRRRRGDLYPGRSYKVYRGMLARGDGGGEPRPVFQSHVEDSRKWCRKASRARGVRGSPQQRYQLIGVCAPAWLLRAARLASCAPTPLRAHLTAGLQRATPRVIITRRAPNYASSGEAAPARRLERDNRRVVAASERPGEAERDHDSPERITTVAWG